MIYTIKYQYGTYSGTERIEAEDGEQAIDEMWGIFRRKGYLTLPMAYKSARIINEEEEQ
jgi:hypothetical protein